MSKERLKNVIEKMTSVYKTEPLFADKHGRQMPSRDAVIGIINDLKKIVFPGYFERNRAESEEHYIGYEVMSVYSQLREQVRAALYYSCDACPDCDLDKCSQRICDEFFAGLPEIQQMLLKDLQAGFDGDPAAKSKEEIIYSYPGLFAIFVFRLANRLYNAKVPLIPRIMTEYAHGRTGIDINPGATVGEYFFIDHGTGVVIGETTTIGNNVKIYQGVTLGALSTRSGQQLAGVKRHPTIEDNVTIYAGATILGGETVIGADSIIGGNCFITQSVPANSRVSAKSSELIVKERRKKSEWEI